MNNKSKSLTLGLACYNVENTVAITLSSILNQELEFIHVIAVDDCSSDSTVEILESYSDRFKKKGYKFSIIKNLENLGVGKTRNLIIEHSDTMFIGFLDPDDHIAPDFSSHCVEAIGDADMLRTDHIRYDGLNRTYVKAPYYKINTEIRPSEFILPIKESSGVDYPFNWSGIFKLNSIIDKNIKFSESRTAEDRSFIWGCHLYLDSMIYSPISGYFYRRGVSNPVSLTSGGNISTFDVFDVLDEIEVMIEDKDHLKKLYRQSLAMMEFHFNRKAIYGNANFKKLLERLHDFFDSKEQDILTEVLAECSDYRKHIFKKVS